jgi:serine/threonine protein kinase
MYEAQDLKNDLLANLLGEYTQDHPLYVAILESEFKFEDTGTFSRIKWNTYQRYLKIYCKQSYKKELDDNVELISSLTKRIHGERDDYYLMSVEIFATSTNLSQNNKNYIVIDKTIRIDKAEQIIGEGGFGRVYKYSDPFLNQLFAIKIFDPSSFHESDTEFLKKRFIREGQRLLHLRHRNISSGYDIGEVADTFYIKMEYIEGAGLIDYLRTSNPDMPTRKKLAEQFISAMAYAHESGVLHRDLSYRNVMVTNDGEIKLLDFGFSRGDKDTTYDTQRCPIVTVFSPPELTEENYRYDFFSEVYCIGAILYTIFTGNEFHSQKLLTISNEQVEKPYDDIILKCLNVNQKDRFESAEEIRNYIFQVNSTTATPQWILPTKSDNFNLDSFRFKLADEVSEILFTSGHLPNISSIQAWLAKGFKSALEENLYVTFILIVDILSKFNGVRRVTFTKKTQSVFLYSDIKEMYEYYLSCDEHKKFYFCKTILTILSRLSREYDDYNDVPF